MNQPKLNLPEGVSFEDETKRLTEITSRVSTTSDFFIFDTGTTLIKNESNGTDPCTVDILYFARGPGAEDKEQALKDAEFATHAKPDILHLLELVARRSNDIAILYKIIEEFRQREFRMQEEQTKSKIIKPY